MYYIYHLRLGLFSFWRSNSHAMLNYLAACFIAGLPSKRIPRGNLPSGDMFFIFNIISYSSRNVLNILFNLATDCILPFISILFFILSYSWGIFVLFISSFIISVIFTSGSSSSILEHFFTIVNNIDDTFSARNGKDHDSTFKSSGSL